MLFAFSTSVINLYFYFSGLVKQSLQDDGGRLLNSTLFSSVILL